MAKIFYSMSGEGRGHATRVRAIVDELRQKHDITLFAPGDAYELLEPAYRGTNVRIRHIPGLRFFYTSRGRLAFGKTALGGLRYLWGYPALSRKIRLTIQREKPDLVLVDFEPSLPRAARKCGVPIISIDHQHFLIVNDLSALPRSLRWHAFLMSQIVRRYFRGETRAVVSSFYFPPLKPGHRDAIQIGVILRPAIREAARQHGRHLVAYLRRFATPNVIEALRQSEREVRIYGLGARPRDGNLVYLDISEENFIRDLATCDALVSTAGNQLVGEALFLGKPVLAMPEPNNHEQYINAFFLKEEGTGEWVELERLTPRRLQRFLNRVPAYRLKIDEERYYGNPLALKTVEDFLRRKAASEP